MDLPHSTIAALRQDFCAGYGPSQTGHRRGVSYNLTRSYFSRFERAGLVPRRAQPYAHWANGPVLPYIGSPWIGRAITTPPAPIGPDWIGKACA